MEKASLKILAKQLHDELGRNISFLDDPKDLIEKYLNIAYREGLSKAAEYIDGEASFRGLSDEILSL